MNDSRLFIEIGIDNNGNLAPIDRTPYERWGEDITNHAVIERVLDYNSEVLMMREKTMRHERDYEYMRSSKPIELPKDGLYTYQKLLLPLKDHVQEGDCYYDNGSFYINDKEVNFDEVWTRKADLCNLFWFDDLVFSIFSLVECFVLTERERLNKVFNNRCKIGCTDNPNAANADFLASAIFVLRHLIKNRKFMEAQNILNRLNTCNGLCKDVRNSLKDCGCG